ncbi:hypothetical protein DPMN_061145 [Dreissena polymorpha]|uniref:B box-type domain-containing protein n=1 Tax=Dreissena polymorpha TaxID=45954 RepID=A0A9D4C721_DREPO|nr:hypothetical protein DPMN_061145 [Dreissena polymorpha]
MYGRGDTSKWPVSNEVEDFLQKCDLHEGKRLELYCSDHSQLCCCTNCAFLNHSQRTSDRLAATIKKDPIYS